MRTFLILIALTQLVSASDGKAPKVRRSDSDSQDIRQQPAKTLNDHFPFKVPQDTSVWNSRSNLLRRRVLVATGLWPMPEKTPLNAVVHGKTERNGFSVEKVYFESLPGHYVTGLLFRPTGDVKGKRPGVLCPHGHGGRMQSHSEAEIASQMQQGAEHFSESGRTPKIARCVQLARMGCVSFIFDMLGYEDSIQISHQVAHRHQNARPEETTAPDQDWIFFSPEADLRCQSIMGLQTWNAIRALDFLESLPDVDKDRLAVTGGSGGGTQSILLGAIDDRVKVSFPNGMVSTSMQGGCYCENCNLLRIDTGNVELAALFAPRPQAMTAADDWTRDMMKDGYPELQWLYAMLGDQEDVYCRPMLHFKHNYNYVTRATMYQWMNQHLKLGLEIPVIEQDFERLTETESSVWNDAHPAPTEIGIAHERAVCRWLDEQSRSLLEQTSPNDEASFKDYQKWFGQAWEIIFDQGLPKNTQWTNVGSSSTATLQLDRALIRCPDRGTEIPVLVARNHQDQKGHIVWTTAEGKDAAFEKEGKPNSRLQALIDSNLTVVIPDLFRQGEWSTDASNVNVPRLVDDKRSYSAFTYGYNRSLPAERCSDLLTVIVATKKQIEKEGKKLPLELFGDEQTAAWSVPAAAIAGSVIDRANLVTNGFRYGTVSDFRSPNFVPGSVKYGDIPSLLALRSPNATTIIGESQKPAVVISAYNAMGSAHQLQFADLPKWHTDTNVGGNSKN